MKYMPRSSWTPTAAGFKRYANRLFDKRSVKGVVLHYPGDGNITRGVLSVAQEAGLFRAYRNWHVGNNGWADIGYNVGIGQSGRAWDLAGLTHAAGHAASNAYPRANHDYFGIVLLLGNDERPSAAMVNTINAVLRDLRHNRGFTGMAQVLGHQQVRGALTACPGRRVMALINAGTFGFGTVQPPTPPATNIAAGTVLEVTANRLNTRSGPGTNHGVVGGADKGIRVTATGRTQGSWVEAQTEWQRKNNVRSWWSLSWLKVVSRPTPPTAPSWRRVNAPNGLNVRSGPGVGNRIVGTAKHGDRFRVSLSGGKPVTQSGWTMGRTDAMRDAGSPPGWVNSRYLTSW